MNIVEALKINNRIRRTRWDFGGYIIFEHVRRTRLGGRLRSETVSYFCEQEKGTKLVWPLDEDDILTNDWEPFPCKACEAESKHTCGEADADPTT